MIGISSNGNYGMSGVYQNYAAMNDMKLSQAMAGRKSTSAISPIKPIKNGTVGVMPSKGSVDFVNDYQSKLNELRGSAKALSEAGSGGSKNTLAANSGDTAVATAKLNYQGAASEGYSIDVKKLATAQVNRSSEVVSSARPANIKESLTITTASGGSATFNTNPSAKSNAEMYASLARDINRKDIGVTASIVERDGKTSLELTANETGEKAGFVATGSLAQKTGLRTAAVAAQNSEVLVTQKGQIGSKTVIGQSNEVELGGGKISATLRGVGKTDITMGKDNEKTMQAVEKLVSSFNDTVRLLSKNTDKGMGVISQFSRMSKPLASAKSLETVGISANLDGTLKLDKSALASSLSKSPERVNEILSGANGIAKKVENTASAGLKTTTSSLLSSELSQNRLNNALKDPLNAMSTYSKAGVYNLSNYYAVGVLMNFNI